jgi:gamma-glutamylputrescine oxidase
MTSASTTASWGETPWEISFKPRPHELPRAVDLAVIGGGFTGLAAAAWTKLLAPEKSVVVLEAGQIGAGASGRSGGMFLAETAAGDQSGLGDVIAGVRRIFGKLSDACGFSIAERAELTLPGAWEIARKGGSLRKSVIQWNDSGTLRVVDEVPGGTINPGGLVSALGEAAEWLGATIFENEPVERVAFASEATLGLGRGRRIRAKKIIYGTNAESLDLTGYGEDAHPRLTLAARTAPISDEAIAALGLSKGKPFYTVDFPYLWGRTRPDNSIIWGAGLLNPPASRDLKEVHIADEEPTRMFATFEKRIHGLHPAMAGARFAHKWGGPILFREQWSPVLDWHRQSEHAIVVGAYAGHGVALSSYFGAWAAEALLGKRALPKWAAMKR